MSEKLQDEIRRICDDRSIATANEMAVRQAAVSPVLEALNWNTRDLNEVIPEFAVGQNRVDYCLTLQGKEKVFVEVKGAREALDAHQEQLLKYAFQRGVSLAVLTNGLMWSLYLPLREGAWDQRRIVDIDFTNESLSEVDRKLEAFLSRSSVASGVAVSEANKVYESTQKADEIERALPKAWNNIVQEPDELLVELLIQAVEDMCHHRPEKKRVESFVTHLPSFSTPEPAKRIRPEPTVKPKRGAPVEFPASVPPAFLEYGALSVKAPYRQFLPPNQENLAPSNRDYFTVSFPGYGEAKAYMSQGRLKIMQASVWRDIVDKLHMKSDQDFIVSVVEPSKFYEISPRE